MSKVFSHMTMSLDGYIAQPDDQPGELFDWYEAGDVNVPNPNETSRSTSTRPVPRCCES